MQAISKPNHGKGAARAIRRQGLVPGIIYAKGDAAGEGVAVNALDLAKALRIGHFFTHTQELNMGGKTIKVLARAVQRHPVTDAPIHIDFMHYDPARIVNVNVVIRVVGQEKSPGIKMGGVLQMIETSLEVTCRADAIPQELSVDVSGLGIGDSVHMSSIALPTGVKSAVTDRDLTIASVVSTRTSKMEETTTATAAVRARLMSTSPGKNWLSMLTVTELFAMGLASFSFSTWNLVHSGAHLPVGPLHKDVSAHLAK
jgi:large subunit ribosomal protein L25